MGSRDMASSVACNSRWEQGVGSTFACEEPGWYPRRVLRSPGEEAGSHCRCFEGPVAVTETRRTFGGCGVEDSPCVVPEGRGAGGDEL